MHKIPKGGGRHNHENIRNNSIMRRIHVQRKIRKDSITFNTLKSANTDRGERKKQTIQQPRKEPTKMTGINQHLLLIT